MTDKASLVVFGFCECQDRVRSKVYVGKIGSWTMLEVSDVVGW